MDGWMDGWMDQSIDQRVDGRMFSMGADVPMMFLMSRYLSVKQDGQVSDYGFYVRMSNSNNDDNYLEIQSFFFIITTYCTRDWESS